MHTMQQAAAGSSCWKVSSFLPFSSHHPMIPIPTKRANGQPEFTRKQQCIVLRTWVDFCFPDAPVTISDTHLGCLTHTSTPGILHTVWTWTFAHPPKPRCWVSTLITLLLLIFILSQSKRSYNAHHAIQPNYDSEQHRARRIMTSQSERKRMDETNGS